MNEHSKKLLAPSILSADFLRLGEQVTAVEKAGADIIHCDVMDGRFVPNLTFGPMVVKAIRSITGLPLDVHLMIKCPDAIIPEFVSAGANYITVHQEEVVHLHRTLEFIKSCGVKAGVAINPATPVAALNEILEIADLLLIMSVNPGFGGQALISQTLKKAEFLANEKSIHNFNYAVEIDGGINAATIKFAVDAGVEIFVAGSSVFSAKDISAALKELKALIS